MSFVGMGWQEILVIGIVAIMIFGPDKLPEMAGQAGKLLRDFRRMTQDMTGEFEKQTGVSVKDLKSNVDKEIAGLKSEMAGTTASMQKELNSVKSSVSKTATSVSKSVNSATGSKSTSGSKSTAKSGSTTKTAKGATTAKSSKAGSKPAKAEPAVPAIEVVASKNDPLAGVSFMDDPESASSNGHTSNGSSNKPAAAPAGAQATGTQADALIRARTRRQTAGYNQGPSNLN